MLHTYIYSEIMELLNNINKLSNTNDDLTNVIHYYKPNIKQKIKAYIKQSKKIHYMLDNHTDTQLIFLTYQNLIDKNKLLHNILISLQTALNFVFPNHYISPFETEDIKDILHSFQAILYEQSNVYVSTIMNKMQVL